MFAAVTLYKIPGDPATPMEQTIACESAALRRWRFFPPTAPTEPPPALEYDSHPLMLRRTIPALQLHILLLLAALSNALAGVPLHEARHLREAVRSVQVAAAAAQGAETLAAAEASLDAATSEQDTEETHAPCAWCLTHALDAGLAHAAARLQTPPTEPRMAVPQGVASFTAQQVRGPFAARDSPPAQWA